MKGSTPRKPKAFAKPWTELSDFPVACREARRVRGHAPSLLPEGRDFRLVWHDEFDGAALDETKWRYRTNFWGRPAHWYARPEDGCVELSGGEAHLRIKRRPDGQFVSPQLQTGQLIWDVPHVENPTGFWPLPKLEPPTFVHRYGYYECRCRTQRHAGWWSAFWMQTESQGITLDPGRSGIEHDIMESFEPGEILPACFHYNGYGANYESFRIPDAGPGAFSRLRLDPAVHHVFGLLWEPDGYSVFVDGRLRGRCAQAVSHVPEFLLVSTECKWYRDHHMTGEGVPELAAAAEAGDSFDVDFVRVYNVVPSES